MKPTPKRQGNNRTRKDRTASILVFGAHPDDIEFGCGAIIAKETQAGRSAHFVVASKGESATSGTPAQRAAEAQHAAAALGASIEFIDLGGDAHFEIKLAHVLTLARIIRKVQPETVLAPTVLENQHPDHAKLGRMVRDACRLARFGGVKELKGVPAHTIKALLFYAITADAEPSDASRILIDVSAPAVQTAWHEAMKAHASQMSVQKYVELQLARVRLWGLRAGVEHAMPLFPSDPLLVESLSAFSGSARKF